MQLHTPIRPIKGATRAEPSAATDTALPRHALLLLSAIGAVVMARGGFYPGGQFLVAVGLVAAAVAALQYRRWTSADSAWILPPAALAGWAIFSAAVAGEWPVALPTVALLTGLSAVVLVSRRTSSAQRDWLVSGLLAIGVLVALSGWIGVVWRVDALAMTGQDLWRASTVLTYPNAAAALLSALILVALARLTAEPRPLVGVAACLMLIGVVATTSRAGLLALALGIMVLVALLGWRAVVRVGMAPCLGAGVALAGLAPSISAASTMKPTLAILALTAGLGVSSLGVIRTRGSLTALGVSLLVMGAGTALLVASSPSLRGSARFSTASADRSQMTAAGLALASENLVTGVGPAQAGVSWSKPSGEVMEATYLHNEYLQVLAELGAVGLALVVGLFGAIAIFLRRCRPARGAVSRPTWAGVVAALAALALHSGFDFLWHVPAIPLVGALLVGLTVPTAKPNP